MFRQDHRMIVPKTPEQIEAMARSGQILARCHRMLRAKARPGVTTKELDTAAEKFIRSQGAVPAFLGYRGFPGSICASLNSMVVHGIPDDTTLARGDLLSLDIGVVLDGWVSDAAVTFVIGKASDEAQRLIDATRASLFAGIEQAKTGNRLGDIGHAIQTVVEDAGFSVIRQLVGHGIGRQMHEEPQIHNFGEPGTGALLEQGTTLAIEPMVNVGGPEIRMGDDEWAVFSKDGSLAAHFEFTVAVAAEGPRILTPWHEED